MTQPSAAPAARRASVGPAGRPDTANAPTGDLLPRATRRDAGISRPLPLELQAALQAKRSEQTRNRRACDRVTRAELAELRERQDRMEALLVQLLQRGVALESEAS